MPSSINSTAELIDSLAESATTFVTESWSAVSITGLTAENARLLCTRSLGAGLLIDSITDSESNLLSVGEIDDHFGLLTVYITKPTDGKYVLSNSGFRFFLLNSESEGDGEVWHVGRLRLPIVTQGRAYIPWDKSMLFEASPKTKNPRSLVKESTNSRTVTSDIRPWILRSEVASLTCSSSIVWIQVCIQTCTLVLPDEVDQAAGELRFKGPPRLTVVTLDENRPPDYVGFERLQAAVSWVFELENQAEIRHLYLKSEIVRSGLSSSTDEMALITILDSAMDGAKISYAMSISELGKDTVKALTDLKKSITEDTAKLTESTRQTSSAVATALAVGFGLLAARVSANAPINLIGLVMIIVSLYIASIIYTGLGLIRLQAQLRSDWHPKIYRFLTDKEYHSMVQKPAKTAEVAFYVTSGIGGAIVAVLTFYILYLWYVSVP